MPGDWTAWAHSSSAAPTRPAVRPGDDVRVWFKLREQGKERLAQFEGVVIRVRGAGDSKTFTVRRLTHGVGVERVFPLDAPVVARVEVLRRGKVRRSRLYFLRNVVRTTRLASAEEPSGPGGRSDASKNAVPAGGSPADRPTTSHA